MSSLTEPFPVSLTISGVECPIHWDFRTVLRCQKILQDAGRELTEDEMTRLLRLFTVSTPGIQKNILTRCCGFLLWERAGA